MHFHQNNYTLLCSEKITLFIIVFKQNVNTVDVVHSTKIHPPPHCLITAVFTYCICPHTRRYVSVHSVVCFVYIGVIFRNRVCRWLCSDFVLWQIIYICTNNWKTLWNALKPETCLKSSNQYTKWWISTRIARKHRVKCICLYL